MKPSSLECSYAWEESMSMNVPLSPSFKKSHSVGSGLDQNATFHYTDPVERTGQESVPLESLHNEPFKTLVAQCEDHAKNASSGLTKVLSLPNLTACRSLYLPPRSRSLDNLCSHLEISVNPFSADSSDRTEHGFYDGTSAASEDDGGGRFHSMRRIEEWVRQIDIHDSEFLEDLKEISSSVSKERRERPKSTPRIYGASVAEAGQRYLSTMSPSSTTARMMNLGLAVIPFLGAFSGLRALDLSGNSIARISTGALPRGLHELNLSRNCITTIEGLRELARLRVLNLSCNRILRIGHGLGGCTMLKELYLGGNKIGEVEGLHRLLKLSILDLQKNKISTAKSIRQLAANYASLQALNLDGNPILTNLGEDQLRRHLSGLLPRLVYLNKHAIKSASSKDFSSCAVTSAATAVKSDRHHHRRGSRGIASDRGSLVTGGHLRGVRGAPLPLAATGLKDSKSAGTGGRLLGGLRPVNRMRRIQSEGTLQTGQ